MLACCEENKKESIKPDATITASLRKVIGYSGIKGRSGGGDGCIGENRMGFWERREN